MRIRLTALLAVALLMILAPAASAQSDTGSVTVVHGVPGVTVDVWVNGDPTLEGFEPGTVTDPLELPAGSYDIEIYPAGADPDSEDPVISGSADLEAGANVSLVAHLDADGNPTLGVFANDTSTIGAGEARITVRHTAAAPAVDILANGDAVFTGVENGQEGVADLPAGTIEAAVARAGETDPVLGPAEVDLGEGVNTIVYAIGSAEEDSLDLLVQTISGLHEAPSGVESGTGGLKAAEQQRAAQLPWLAGLTAILLAGMGLGVRRIVPTRR
jgi:hypothetical protein